MKRIASRWRGIVAAVLAVCLSTACTAEAGVNGDATRVRFALDWTPNTNHTGLFVAIHRGWFEDAGLDVEVLPYGSTSPDTLIDSGQAEFGVSFHSAATFARAAGADTVAVMAVLQHWASAIAVRADRGDVRSPKDLSGLTYAGFGDAGEVETIRQVIENDGGDGSFRNVTLGTSAYEAVYAGRADFTVPFLAWEGLEASRQSKPFKYFHYTDFGFPDSYAVVVNAGGAWIKDHPEEARAFVRTLKRGYEFAVDNPTVAADDLIAANPDAFADTELVHESQAMLSAEYLKDANGRVGAMDLDRWSGFSRFLFACGLLVDVDGKPLATEPDWSTYFTNDLLG